MLESLLGCNLWGRLLTISRARCCGASGNDKCSQSNLRSLVLAIGFWALERRRYTQSGSVICQYRSPVLSACNAFAKAVITQSTYRVRFYDQMWGGGEKNAGVIYIWGCSEKERSNPAMMECRYNTNRTIS